MVRICILTAGRFPVPVSQGGAVESLVDLLAQNYQVGCFDFSLDIISIHSEKSEQLSHRYDKVNYIYIKKNKICEWIYNKINFRYRKVFSKEPFFLNTYLTRAVKEIKLRNYDCILIENRPDYVIYIKENVNIPCISHIHNDFLNSNIQGAFYVAKNTDLIITVSNYIKSRVHTLNIPNVPIRTVHNVVDLHRFCNKSFSQAEKLNLRASLGLSSSDVVCVFVGRLDANKGVDKLIDAIKIINEKHIKLLIIGASFYEASNETAYVNRLKEIAAPVRDNIVFTGYIANDELYKYYYIADISVTPSQWEEPAGLVILEAQACGLPVIATRCGGIPEYLCEKSGILIEKNENFTLNLAKAIRLLANDKNMREEMGLSGLDSVKKFNPDCYLEQIIKVVGNRNEHE